eukprot:TRINITY_DN10277_c0_g1_i1.p1 TRINITY_DN10277_c0_g1~~TRINITY_DN10277_c0_g1_i1.p1  ORF type:complete len:230 (-),score=44.14 TRINITY_DN10277_c0_g1_i1:1106-1795(-)
MALVMPKSQTPSSAAAAGTKPAAKRGRTEADEEAKSLPPSKLLEKLVVATSKLSLNSAQKSRALSAAVSETYIIQEDGELAQALRKAGTTYNALCETTEVVDRPLTIGLPHMHAWSELIGYLQNHPEAKPEDKQKIDEYVKVTNTWQSQGLYWVRLDEQVTIVRMLKAFKSGKKKFEIAVTPGTESREIWVQVLKPLLLRTKTVHLTMGQAPRGAQELAVQSLLEQLDK